MGCDGVEPVEITQSIPYFIYTSTLHSTLYIISTISNYYYTIE